MTGRVVHCSLGHFSVIPGHYECLGRVFRPGFRPSAVTVPNMNHVGVCPWMNWLTPVRALC